MEENKNVVTEEMTTDVQEVPTYDSECEETSVCEDVKSKGSGLKVLAVLGTGAAIGSAVYFGVKKLRKKIAYDYVKKHPEEFEYTYEEEVPDEKAEENPDIITVEDVDSEE